MIHKALKIAERSTHRKHMTGCIIADVSGKTPVIVSQGWSHIGNWDYGTGLYSVHAEIHALIRARPLSIKGCIAYVGTIARKSGNITNALPCLTCATALVAAGIEDVVYSVSGIGTLVQWKATNLPNAIKNADLKIYKERNE